MSDVEVNTRPPMRRIWLTAADSGIGLALAARLLEAGHHLALTAMTQAPLLKLAGRYPSQVLLVNGDIRDGQQLRAMADKIDQHWGALDTAICSARPYTLTDAASPDGVLCDDVVTACLYVQEALPLLHRGQQAHLVGVAAVGAQGNRRSGAQATDLRQVFGALRADLAGESIDVSVIDPQLCSPQAGPVDTVACYIVDQLARTTRVLDIRKPTRLLSNLRLLGGLPGRVPLTLGRYLARSLLSKKDL